MTSVSHTAGLFEQALQRAEQRLVMLRANKFEPRLLMRYVRSLRACDRLRLQILRETKQQQTETPTQNETIREIPEDVE